MTRWVLKISILQLALLLCTTACSSGLLGKQRQAAALPPAGSAQLLTDPSSKCQLKTVEQWQDFVDRTAGDSRWAATCEDSQCDNRSHEFVEAFVRKPLANCADVIDNNPGIKRCTERLSRYVPTWLRQHDDVSYGFNRGNHVYLGAQDGPTMPEGLVQPPQAIIDALPTRDKVEAAARSNGWKYLTHDSAIDNIRTFIYVPDPKGRFDQWMILNLAAPGEEQAALIFSVLGVQKADRDGKPLPRVKLHFRDYNVVDSGGHFGLEFTEQRAGKCYSCHTSGTRKLIDRETKVTSAKPVKGEPDYDPAGTKPAPAGFGVKRLEELNTILMSYGLPDWDGDIVPEEHGPVLGAKQGCTACHNGSNRGVLTISTSESQIGKKISDQLSMPQEEGLIKLKERSELAQATMTDADKAKLQAAQEHHDDILGAYMDDRLPALNDWMSAEKCQ